MESFDPLQFDYCSSLLSAIDESADSPLQHQQPRGQAPSAMPPVLCTPSPQDILNAPFIGDSVKTTDEWTNEPLLALQAQNAAYAFDSVLDANPSYISEESPNSANSALSSPHRYSSYTSDSDNFNSLSMNPLVPDQYYESKGFEDLVDSSQYPVKQESTSPKVETPLDESVQSSRQSSYPSQASTRANTRTSKVSKPKKEKTSHNMIEKRYRTNINDRILALRDCVPALRCVITGNPEDENLQGLTPAAKLNKATVLTKATEYIRHLEARNVQLAKELEDLKNSLNPTANSEPQFSPVFGRSNRQFAPQRPGRHSDVASKAMMCSMAGLMGAGMMGSDSNSEFRGLSAIPGMSLFSSVRVGAYDGSSLLTVVKLGLILGALGYVIIPMLSGGKSDKELEAEKEAETLEPLNGDEAHRNTWLTTSVSLHPPRGETAFGDLFALFGVVLEVIVTLLVGIDGYILASQFFTGSRPNISQQIARAMDAQLCGGDPEFTSSRMVYTFLKGFLLPGDWQSYMLQALQIRTLIYDSSFPLRNLGILISDRLWAKARKAARAAGLSPASDELPSHIVQLLESPDFLDCGVDSYFSALLYGGQAVSDINVDAYSSALDVAAAFYCSRKLHDTLLDLVEGGASDFDRSELSRVTETCPADSDVKQRALVLGALFDTSKTDLKAAIDHLKGDHELLVRVIESGEQVEASITEDAEEDDHDSDFSSESDATIHEAVADAPVKAASPPRHEARLLAVSNDCRIALYCSYILHYLALGDEEHALAVAMRMQVRSEDSMGLLGFVALRRALLQLRQLPSVAGESKLEQLAAAARVWVGSEVAEETGLSLERRRELVGDCVELSVYFGGLELDEGYCEK